MSNAWNRLSTRERNLAVLVATLLVAGVALLLVRHAQENLDLLDTAIDQRTQTLINYTNQMARSQSVDQAYARVAAQHSSAWTEAEIHDRLRQEIYRIAMKDPPAEGEPVSSRDEDLLVTIPTLRQGTLQKGGDGYREYQLSIQIPTTDIESMITFLERLQASTHSLRIDGLQLFRSPTTTPVSAVINITRTVVDRAPDALLDAGPAGAAPSAVGGQYVFGKATEDWHAEGCTVTLSETHATAGPDCIQAVATQANAVVFLSEALDTGQKYVLCVDLTATGPAELRIMQDGTVAPQGAVKIEGDGVTRQYRIDFAVPPMREFQATVCLPYILIEQASSEVFIDSIVIRKVTG
ncbi:MAG TPA: hypothetical protein PLO37_00520 [Candidatus Hydrogenedentes bacterium]|nr:hypothetical protein [Candidatus Hydrogenedentota bacterium]HPG65297.1 hypothetical protein [Candidatus Hydrogenedentota bacterium]